MKHLVLLHGWGATERIWRQQAEAFEERCTVLTPRLAEWDAAWLQEYLTRLPLPETVLVGWSLGGMLLIEALGQIAGPAAAAAVLVGVAPVFCQRPGHPWGQPLASVRAMRLGLRSAPARVLTNFLASCLAAGEEAFRDEAAAGFDFTADPAHLALLSQGLDYLRDKDLCGLLPHLRGRVAIIQGQQDGIVDPAQARFLHEHLPGASLHILPGAGHLPFLTQPEAFNDILRGLISDDAHEPLPRKLNPPESPLAKGGL